MVLGGAGRVVGGGAGAVVVLSAGAVVGATVVVVAMVVEVVVDVVVVVVLDVDDVVVLDVVVDSVVAEGALVASVPQALRVRAQAPSAASARRMNAPPPPELGSSTIGRVTPAL